MTKEMVEKQAVLALEKDVCVLTKDIGVYRFKSIDPQAVELLYKWKCQKNRPKK